MVRTRPAMLGAAVLVVVFASGYVAGQRQAPTATVGQSEELLRSMALAPEF